MLEEQCRSVFKEACLAEIEKHESLVKLKGRMRQKNEFENYITWEDTFSKWDGWLVKKIVRTQKDNIVRDAFLYFMHGEKIRDAYIRKHYGTIENAMRETGSFGKLFDGFLEEFASRRAMFMNDMEQLIESAKQTAIKQNRSKGMPQSHGGVANLLKILTQTMKAQGSSIRTIAKVQYAVCIQAGILIPDEFITDVLVAANIEKEATA